MALKRMAQDKAIEKVATNAKSEKRVTKSHIVQLDKGCFGVKLRRFVAFNAQL